MLKETDGDILPPCHTERGCYVSDVAGDLAVETFIRKFILAKRLHQACEMPAVQERVFNELGLLDEPEFLLALEIKFREWNKVQSDLEAAKKGPRST